MRIWFVSVAFCLALPAAAVAAPPDDRQSRDFFETRIRPLLAERCYKCHSKRAEKLRGELLLDSKAGWMTGGSRGPAIKPGDPDGSRLIRAVRYDDPELQMPPSGKLSDREIALLVEWVKMGAPDPRGAAAAASSPAPAPGVIGLDEPRQFWAFRPLGRGEPPAAPATPPDRAAAWQWCRTPIDRFVMAKLDERSLTPNPPADRRTLIRRAYFDLTGLPPTPAEVEAFVNDPSPDAYAKLIDRLLENPHFGERWGRHWLDVARFAESHGFEQDYDRPHAYHYRDFVIRALNADMPYDQFVRWQIAGDEFEPDNPLAMMATGFLGAGVFPTQLTEKEFEPARYDELDDMATTLGTAMLGLTIGCARCHDHKFDPIPSRDYYRLISTFTTTIRSNIELDLTPNATRVALAQWEEAHRPLVAARDEFEREQLPRRFDEWLASNPKLDMPRPPWVVLDLLEYQSAGGATLARLDDGSLLAGGTNPDFDKYTLVAHTDLRCVTAIRVEALSHESFVKGGPGRAANGNFGLGNFTLAAEPLRREAGQPAAPPVQVKLRDPRASFEQDAGNLSIAASIDDNPKSGWAVDPQFGKNHTAVFHTNEEIGFEGGTKLTFTLEFGVNKQHNIGRPRLSISTAARAVALDGASEPQSLVEIRAILDRAGAGLTDDDRRRLLTWYRTTDADWRRLNQQVEQHLAAKPKPNLATVMVTSEGFKPIPHHADERGFPHFYKETHFLKRGDTTQKEDVATPGFLQVLMTSPVERWQLEPPEGSRTSYRRRALANWLTDPGHGAGHLLARVIVNRLWQHHVGRGIAATPSDFGVQGERPTHPELLDWLAGQLIEGGWRLKPLHKLIMTSAVYTQGSAYDAADAKTDPDDVWHWRHEPRRLEAETVRDSMLAVSGQLDPTMFGPGTLDEGMKRRSIYFMIKRSKLIPMMQLFDAPEPLVGVAARPSTTIAPQALMFMNNPQVRGYARSFAARLAPAADRSLADAVRQGYLMAIAREPTEAELKDMLAFLDQQVRAYAADRIPNGRELALSDFCQVLMSLNEFVFVE